MDDKNEQSEERLRPEDVFREYKIPVNMLRFQRHLLLKKNSKAWNLPFEKVGRKTFYRRSDIEALFKTGRVEL